MDSDRVTVTRVLVYEGSREWVEQNLVRRAVKGCYNSGPDKSIREVFLQEVPGAVLTAPDAHLRDHNFLKGNEPGTCGLCGERTLHYLHGDVNDG